VSPNRMVKKLSRLLKVSWREQPTRFDIEAMQANVRRIGLVIRVRWILVGALAMFSVLASSAYAAEYPWGTLWPNMVVPAVALALVLVYNTFYQLNYRRMGNIAIFGHAQLLLDAAVVTVLVYYSGGVHSWFWAMYSLFVLEAAFILPKRRDAWFIAGAGAVLAGCVTWGEYLGVLPHVEMPYVPDPLNQDFTFVSVRYLWQVTVMAGTATIATLMMSVIREREAELAASSIVDDTTGLYDRRYFLRALGSEVLRAEHHGRTPHVLLVDIDRFGEFNRILGLELGDEMLRQVASSVVAALGNGSEHTSNVASRYGGEEFALLLAERSDGGMPTVQDALNLAEGLRVAVEELRLHDAGVTLSIGVASYPENGSSADTLLDSADHALNEAKTVGGNAVRVGD